MKPKDMANFSSFLFSILSKSVHLHFYNEPSLLKFLQFEPECWMEEVAEDDVMKRWVRNGKNHLLEVASLEPVRELAGR
jgi:hypothetical protein